MTDKQYEWLLKRLSKNKEDTTWFEEAIDDYEQLLDKGLDIVDSINVSGQKKEDYMVVYLLDKQLLAYLRLSLKMTGLSQGYREYLRQHVDSVLLYVEKIYQSIRLEALEKKKGRRIDG